MKLLLYWSICYMKDHFLLLPSRNLPIILTKKENLQAKILFSFRITKFLTETKKNTQDFKFWQSTSSFRRLSFHVTGMIFKNIFNPFYHFLDCYIASSIRWRTFGNGDWTRIPSIGFVLKNSKFARFCVRFWYKNIQKWDIKKCAVGNRGRRK